MRARSFVLAAGFIFTTYLCGIGKLLAQDATYEFKGNSLGMTLEEFKRQHFSGYVYYERRQLDQGGQEECDSDGNACLHR